MKKFLLPILGILLALFAICSQASTLKETRRSLQAIHCSEIFSIFLQFYSSDQELRQKFHKAIEIFTDVALKEMNLPMTNAQLEAMAERRSNVIKDLLNDKSKLSPNLREDAVMCGAWAEGFLAQGGFYQYVPVYPKVVPPSIRDKYQVFFDEVFER